MENLIFNLVLSDRGLATNKFREFFVTLDYVAFFLFQHVMQLLFDLIKITVNEDFYRPLYDRVYVILAIYMLFKVTISIITYIVNPDSMTDKSQGAGKLVTRIIISLSLLIFCPTAFNMMGKLQKDLISNNTVEKLVLGPGAGGVSDKENFGASLGWDIYNGTFVYYNGDQDHNKIGEIGSFEEISDKINDEYPGDRNHYVYDYIPFVGFVLGLALTVITLGLCIDVAIRVFKLLILQIIAPIPILSYIDPKSSKDGAFSKWLKMLGSVWIDIFVRMAIVYFVVLLIQRLIQESALDGLDTGGLGGVFVKIALIIGLLFFAKQAPKFIYDALGMKAPERGLFAGVGNIMAAGAIAGGAVGSVVASGRSSWMADDANGHSHWNPLNLAKNAGAALFGGIGGAVTGIGAAVNAKDHNARAAMEAMNKRNQMNLSRGAAGSTLLGRLGTDASRMFTGDSAYDRDQAAIAAMEAKATTGKQLQEYLEDRAMKKGADTRVTASGSYGSVSGTLNDYYNAWNSAKTTGDATFEFDGRTWDTFGSDAGAIEGDLKAAAGKTWADSVDRKSTDGRTLTVLENVFNQTLDSKDRRGLDIHNSNQVKGIRKDNETKAFEAKNSKDVGRHKANSGNTGK